jgi:tricorn protease
LCIFEALQNFNTMETLKTFILAFLCLSSFAVSATDPKDTRLMSQPAISENYIAFIYAEDLWIANTNGANPRRLTVDEGIESNPVFSPDGQQIAFSAQYDGNIDVFSVPVEGGIPARLTFHPGPDIVRGFTPDGAAILFSSQRATFTNRFTQLFTVPVKGGFPAQLVIPNASCATYSPDGKYMAYNPLAPSFKQWKNYRGGTISTIWLFSFENHSVVKIPQPQGGCNDSEPQWIGDNVYFRSDREGEFNLYSYSVASKEIKQLTHFRDFPVISLSGFPSTNVIFEQAGYLHVFDIRSSTHKKLTIGISADLLELRARFVKGNTYIRSVALSPSGARAVVNFRGDIVTLPAELGDPRNLTATTGAHERYPSWSPNGKSIAYFSDASGEYELHIAAQDGKGIPKVFRLNGSGFYAHPSWAPDSKKISFVDNARNLYVLDVMSGAIKKIDSDELYGVGAFRKMAGNWAADSRWLAYTKVTETNFRRIFLYSLDQNKSFAVTDGLSDASEPVFDPSGKYLFFFASTNAGPVLNWFDQSSIDMRSTNSIYLVTLQKNIASPFTKESDEETVKAEELEKKKSEKEAAANTPSKKEPLQIDLEGLQTRIVDVPLKAGNYSQLGIAKEGELLYVEKTYEDPTMGTLHKYDIKKQKSSAVMELSYYLLAADGKKMVYFKDAVWGITAVAEKPEAGKGILNTSAIQVKIDPVEEWQHIFDEAWRVNRDYFYDPGMHGADWPAMKKKYAQFLPHLSCRSDLNVVIQWMCSELSVGHHRVSHPGDRMTTPEIVNVGLLGADYAIVNNRYQLKKIYGGLNWNPSLRSPLTEPGINAKAGDYILAVNGKNITAAENIYSFFENTAGKIIELTIGPNPTLSASRTVNVVPVDNEYALRNRDWVEDNLRKVEEATNGQVAYVYVPNTGVLGHEYFKRYFFPQVNKKAIIIDERFNGGGQLADYYINLLQQPLQAHWNLRYGNDMKTPTASIQGPRVMIIDETAGSGGDMLPWMFNKFKMGTLVGKRTWGGLVGILGFPEFIDGGAVTAPNIAIWTPDGFIVENAGVPPDIEVEQWPAEVIKGNDPQLQKAIDVALKELEKNPPVKFQRPPYPVRVKK